MIKLSKISKTKASPQSSLFEGTDNLAKMNLLPEKVRFLGQGQFGDVWMAKFSSGSSDREEDDAQGLFSTTLPCFSIVIFILSDSWPDTREQ